MLTAPFILFGLYWLFWFLIFLTSQIYTLPSLIIVIGVITTLALLPEIIKDANDKK